MVREGCEHWESWRTRTTGDIQDPFPHMWYGLARTTNQSIAINGTQFPVELVGCQWKGLFFAVYVSIQNVNRLFLPSYRHRRWSFGILLKDTLTCNTQEAGIKPMAPPPLEVWRVHLCRPLSPLTLMGWYVLTRINHQHQSILAGSWLFIYIHVYQITTSEEES